MDKKKAARKQIERLIKDDSIDLDTSPLSDLGHSYSYKNDGEKESDNED